MQYNAAECKSHYDNMFRYRIFAPQLSHLFLDSSCATVDKRAEDRIALPHLSAISFGSWTEVQE